MVKVSIGSKKLFLLGFIKGRQKARDEPLTSLDTDAEVLSFFKEKFNVEAYDIDELFETVTMQ